MDDTNRKESGAYYTPDEVVRSLVKWVVRQEGDRLLDPACGDGRFLIHHPKSVGVEQDASASAVVHQRVPGSLIHEGDFFSWAAETRERFHCAAGNPPFIRYQRFTGKVRHAALRLCARFGADFSSLSSSWAPFVVGTASLLLEGGRLAFVVPAEIGHAPYARPVLEYLADHFLRVRIIAVREKLFSDLSEDCWLLYAEGFGGTTGHFELTALDCFTYRETLPRPYTRVPVADWRRWRCRLRPFLLPAAVRDFYDEVASGKDALRLGDHAQVSIGYVTGANDFFHFRPSAARSCGIPSDVLVPTVRHGRLLSGPAITAATLADWQQRDEAMLLLRLTSQQSLPAPVRRYLDSAAGQEARTRYKCRVRTPWYAVPDVTVPDGFLSYMSSNGPRLVANRARCACTNSVHAVELKPGATMAELQRAWNRRFTQLSCEIEGHPLGGGMLKVEPREASNVLLMRDLSRLPNESTLIDEGIHAMRRWRHHG